MERLDPGTGRELLIAEITDQELPLFVAEEDILVRADHASRAQDVLKTTGLTWSEPEPVDCDFGLQDPCGMQLPVVRFTSDGVSVTDLEKAVKALHDQGIDASFNHVMPDGGIKGGNGTAALVPPTVNIPGVDPNRAGLGAGVTVAVIDTGIVGTAPSRSDDWLDGIDITADNTDQLDANGSPSGLDAGAGHGTFVAGVVRQVAPAARVLAYRALNSDGVGTEAGIACAMVRAWHDGADIINLSLGQESFGDRPPVALAAALDLIPEDVIIVASAGNLAELHPHNDPIATRPHWPAAFRRVVAVGGLDQDGSAAEWSKRGPWVDISTIGEGIVSTYVEGTEETTAENPSPETFVGPDAWAMWLGTSFAAPQITGLIAAAMRGNGARRTAREALVSVLSTITTVDASYGRIVTSPLPA